MGQLTRQTYFHSFLREKSKKGTIGIEKIYSTGAFDLEVIANVPYSFTLFHFFYSLHCL